MPHSTDGSAVPADLTGDAAAHAGEPGCPAARPLFLVGCPRSGSTWLTFLLAQHPRVAASQHVAFFHAMSGLDAWWQRQRAGPEQGFGKRVVQVDLGEAGDLEPARYLPICGDEEYHRLCRATAGAVYDWIAASKPGATVVLDKTPEHGRLGRFILKVFPEACFLHLVRDPRSVYASLRSASRTFEPGFPANPVAAARFWARHVTDARAIGRLTGNYREVRYEDLLASAAAELRAILDWLGLEAEPGFCEQAAEGARIDRLREVAHAPDGFFRKGSGDAWRSELRPSEVAAIERLAGGLMAELGYPLSGRRGGSLPLYVDAALGRACRLAARIGRGVRRRLGYPAWWSFTEGSGGPAQDA